MWVISGAWPAGLKGGATPCSPAGRQQRAAARAAAHWDSKDVESAHQRENEKGND